MKETYFSCQIFRLVEEQKAFILSKISFNSETQYVLLDIPKLGTHPVAIVTLKEENVINLRFPVLSSDRNSK